MSNVLSKEALMAGLLLLAIFAGGIAVGLGLSRFGDRPAQHRRPPPPTERLIADLGLDEDQAQRFRAAFERARDRAQAVHRQQKPALDAIFEQAKAEARKALTPAQQKRFDAMPLHPPRPPGPPGGGPGPGHPPPPGFPPPPGPPRGAPPPG